MNSDGSDKIFGFIRFIRVHPRTSVVNSYFFSGFSTFTALIAAASVSASTFAPAAFGCTPSALQSAGS